MGDDNIRQVFTDHFKSLYQPNTPGIDSGFAGDIDQLLAGSTSGPIPFIDIETINTCIGSLKHRKTPGHDGISNEHIIYSSSTLLVHISLLFNACLRHKFVPSDYCFGVILPLLKNKHGDASMLDMCLTLLCRVLFLNCLKALWVIRF